MPLAATPIRNGRGLQKELVVDLLWEAESNVSEANFADLFPIARCPGFL